MNKRRLLAVLLVLLVIVVAGVTGRGLLLRWGVGEGRAVIEALQPGVDVELPRFVSVKPAKECASISLLPLLPPTVLTVFP